MMELLGHDVFREFGLVAFAAQVREVKVAQPGGHDLRGGFGGVHVREMAVAAQDALLERPRAARTILQHLHVVVGFEHEGVRVPDAVKHELGRVAEVGGKADVAVRGAQKISDRVLRVVRNGKRLDAHVADFKPRAGLEQPPVNFRFECVLGFQGEVGFLAPLFLERPNRSVLCVAVAINRDVKFIREAEQAGDVIRVFVGDQNGGEIFRRAADSGEALADLQRGKSGVHEDAGFGGLDVGAIAGGAAAEDGEFDGHKKTLPAGKMAGKFFPAVNHFNRAYLTFQADPA
jgi:hypothetical protein